MHDPSTLVFTIPIPFTGTPPAQGPRPGQGRRAREGDAGVAGGGRVKPSLVLSGGQTGVDQAALRAAVRCGIPTGGWAPKGWRTEVGPMPALAAYGLKEHASRDYAARTADNVRDADFVLVIGRPSPGSTLTVSLAKRYGKRFIWESEYLAAPLTELVLDHIDGVSWLVAGNRESVSPGIGAAVESWLVRVWS